MKREKIKTTKQQIADYWFSLVDESDLSLDASEAQERCWRCGCEGRLEKCHIMPYSRGGMDVPSNLVLLCSRCHIDNPNIADSEIMWDWIRAYSTPLYNTFWTLQGMKEYQFIYKRSIEQELEERQITDIKEFQQIVTEQLEKTTYHFGHPNLNSATLAGVFKASLKHYDEIHSK